MSLNRKVIVNCPRCGKQSETTVWESLNTSLDPQAKLDLFLRRINIFNCKLCGFSVPMDTMLLYNDMESEFCVRYCPDKTMGDRENYRGLNAQGELDLQIPGLTAGTYLQKAHIVFSMDEMLRYIAFRERLKQFRQDGRLGSGMVCFSCDRDILHGDAFFISSRHHQRHTRTSHLKDPFLDSVAALQICAPCMLKASRETIVFPETPRPLLSLESPQFHLYAKWSCGISHDFQDLDDHDYVCVVCKKPVEEGQSYYRLAISEEITLKNQNGVKEEATYAIWCEHCARANGL